MEKTVEQEILEELKAIREGIEKLDTDYQKLSRITAQHSGNTAAIGHLLARIEACLKKRRKLVWDEKEKSLTDVK